MVLRGVVDSRCPSRRDGYFLTVGVGDGQWVLDHAASPCEADPSKLVGYDGLYYGVVGARGRIAGEREAEDNVGAQCEGGLVLGEGEASLLIHVRDSPLGPWLYSSRGTSESYVLHEYSLYTNRPTGTYHSQPKLLE